MEPPKHEATIADLARRLDTAERERDELRQEVYERINNWSRVEGLLTDAGVHCNMPDQSNGVRELIEQRDAATQAVARVRALAENWECLDNYEEEGQRILEALAARPVGQRVCRGCHAALPAIAEWGWARCPECRDTTDTTLREQRRAIEKRTARIDELEAAVLEIRALLASSGDLDAIDDIARKALGGLPPVNPERRRR